MNTNKLTKRAVAAACGALLAIGAGSARADLIWYADYFEGSVIGNPTAELNFVQGQVNNFNLVYLDKWDSDENDWEGDGSLAGGTYIDVDIDGSSGEVRWNLFNSGFELNWVLLKNGRLQQNCGGENQPPCGHLYTLFEVTPDQFVSSDGWQSVFFGDPNEVWSPINRDISHLTFLGQRAPTEVSEPGIMALLGLGLFLAAGVLRRRVQR